MEGILKKIVGSLEAADCVSNFSPKDLKSHRIFQKIQGLIHDSTSIRDYCPIRDIIQLDILSN